LTTGLTTVRKSKIELLVIEKLHMNNKEQQNIQSEKTLTEIFKYNAEAGASRCAVLASVCRFADKPTGQSLFRPMVAAPQWKVRSRNLRGCRLADHCIRTWFFVQNVDVNYAGVVKARNEVFVTQNLTEKTHYISSTGIGGRHADPKVLVQMDTYAIAGVKPEQIHFLYAPTHLNPTYEYGVSFERGTYVDVWRSPPSIHFRHGKHQ